MDQSKNEVQLTASVTGFFGFLTFVAVTFIAPANGEPWLWAEIVGPLWIISGLLAAGLVWRFRLPTSEYVGYMAFSLGSLGLLGLIAILCLERWILRPIRRSPTS